MVKVIAINTIFEKPSTPSVDSALVLAIKQVENVVAAPVLEIDSMQLLLRYLNFTDNADAKEHSRVSVIA